MPRTLSIENLIRTDVPCWRGVRCLVCNKYSPKKQMVKVYWFPGKKTIFGYLHKRCVFKFTTSLL